MGYALGIFIGLSILLAYCLLDLQITCKHIKIKLSQQHAKHSKEVSELKQNYQILVNTNKRLENERSKAIRQKASCNEKIKKYEKFILKNNLLNRYNKTCQTQ